MKKILVMLLFSSYVIAQNPPPPPPPLVPLTPPSDPAGNPSTTDKVMLGKTLYWDEQLSSTKTVACATCHIVDQGGVDPRAFFGNPDAVNPGADGLFLSEDDIIASQGVIESCSKGAYIRHEDFAFKKQVTGRFAPSVLNAGFADSLFWDGRAETQLIDPESGEVALVSGAALESQVLAPPLSSTEMAHDGRNWAQVISRITRSSPLALSPSVPQDMQDWISDHTYPELFQLAFGDAEISAVRLAMAIASYERSLFVNQSPFDANVAGNPNALTQQERNGLQVFRGSGCAGCHATALLSDNNFHNTGVVPNDEDEGRFAVTNRNADIGRFKTPPLRNLEFRTAFMHNGSLSTLEEVVDFYDRGGNFANPNLDPRIRPLNLTQNQKNNLVAFLKRPLTDQRVVNATGPFSRPMLYTEGQYIPAVTSVGVAGQNGKIPTMIAEEPPLLGNDNFTVAVENARADSEAVFVVGLQDPGVSQLPQSQDNLIYASILLRADLENDGYGSLAVRLPSNAGLAGQKLYGRWYVEDAQSVVGYAISPLLEMTLFEPDFGQKEELFNGNFEAGIMLCD